MLAVTGWTGQLSFEVSRSRRTVESTAEDRRTTPLVSELRAPYVARARGREDVAGNWETPRTDVNQPARPSVRASVRRDRLSPGRLCPSLVVGSRGQLVDRPSINLTPPPPPPLPSSSSPAAAASRWEGEPTTTTTRRDDHDTRRRISLIARDAATPRRDRWLFATDGRTHGRKISAERSLDAGPAGWRHLPARHVVSCRRTAAAHLSSPRHGTQPRASAAADISRPSRRPSRAAPRRAAPRRAGGAGGIMRFRRRQKRQVTRASARAGDGRNIKVSHGRQDATEWTVGLTARPSASEWVSEHLWRRRCCLTYTIQPGGIQAFLTRFQQRTHTQLQ